MDIIYVGMHKGWVYLCAVEEWYSRKRCLGHRSLGHARAIFNTDQGSQFTNDAFTGQFKRHGVRSPWMARHLA